MHRELVALCNPAELLTSAEVEFPLGDVAWVEMEPRALACPVTELNQTLSGCERYIFSHSTVASLKKSNQKF